MMTPVYRYRARRVRTIDGDTAEFDIDLGFKVHAILPIRIYGVFAPEARTGEGQVVTAWLEALLDKGDIVIETDKLKSGADRQSFARYVASVYVSGKSLEEHYREAGFAPGGIGVR